MYSLGKNLQYLLVKHNINNNQLSKVISVGSSVVGKWIKGEIIDLKLASIVSIANFFNVSLDSLIFCNLEAQDNLLQQYTSFEYVKLFEWNEQITSNTIKSMKIPSILIHDSLENIFIVEYPPEYEKIFPRNTVLLFKKSFVVEKNDILLIRNKILHKHFLVIYDGETYNNLITQELVDINQSVIEGILASSIFSKVFCSL